MVMNCPLFYPNISYLLANVIYLPMVVPMLVFIRPSVVANRIPKKIVDFFFKRFFHSNVVHIKHEYWFNISSNNSEHFKEKTILIYISFYSFILPISHLFHAIMCVIHFFSFMPVCVCVFY